MNARSTLPPFSISRSRKAPVVLSALVLFVATTPARALTLLEACRASDPVLVCRLRSILTMLYTAAGILAVLLIGVVLAAVGAYKRKSRKLTPDEITRDAE